MSKYKHCWVCSQPPGMKLFKVPRFALPVRVFGGLVAIPASLFAMVSGFFLVYLVFADVGVEPGWSSSDWYNHPDPELIASELLMEDSDEFLHSNGRIDYDALVIAIRWKMRMKYLMNLVFSGVGVAIGFFLGQGETAWKCKNCGNSAPQV
jgi:hypothetical protein